MASDWWLAATVLRLMHENQLLSPNRHPPRPANDHDGTILTTAPDWLWGTDASMVQTVADGRVWVFAALDHFNSEVIGHYVSTDGSRFAALEPISQAVSARFRGIEADVARGVTVRADHGPQYISGHFTHQIAHLGNGAQRYGVSAMAAPVISPLPATGWRVTG
jgi:putative transposase